ncbi:heat stress transcription factor A-1e-like [Mercurialis annua]|uniref:heat stress transcription factor A-1e-like n=1 Tax=Mercurialis annua TaxID=3986 RepID=UPI002160E477|nr:heat stress transcription factor A-1e-like [Mercurialis annua]
MESNTVPPFLSKTYDMVDDPSTDLVVSWSNSDNSFVVWNVPEFQKELLPKYFKHNNFSSFVRQLNTYGFRKVDPDRFEFANERFLKGQKHLLKSISRKKPLHGPSNQPPQVQGSKVSSCVEVGKFGLEEEVERLKRDKNVLMQELVRVRQQQQVTDNQLQTVGQRVKVMEQRQQQMMSFLAKAMQSPGFFNQLVQQNNDTNRCISGGTKKRRLPRQEEENLAGKVGGKSPDGQIVKFHSSMNEAAKSMLHQIMKMNSSRREPGPFPINDLPSNGLDSNITSSQISELMLSDVPPASDSSFLPVESGFSVSHPSNSVPEIESPCLAIPGCVKAEMKVANTGLETNPLHLPDIQGILPPSAIDIANMDFVVDSETGNGDINPEVSFFDMEMPVETDAFSPDQDQDILADVIPKLPGSSDAFWEQFLRPGSLTGDTDDINSSSPDSQMTGEQELQSWPANDWENIQNMNHLTEQMELLTSKRRV